ncbi:ModD protein [Sulfurimonas sp. HSL3-7]|uniref:ModD protein n=1 Tax=Sulfonitrofixus jiaomeiensis TaxID=3131938 RepID=UPI0031F88A65
MTRLSDHELWAYIREDLPYFDLTTHLLEVSSKTESLSIITRDKVVAACTEEAARIGELLGCEVYYSVASGTKVEEEGLLLELQGDGEVLHQAWRLCQILLEYACGMATHANRMLQDAHNVNPDCEILVTRKSFPFAKRFTMRALLIGGVMPHRLGLSESVLIFENHRALYDDEAAFEAALPQIKKRCVEKKLVVESESLEDAKRMLQLGADVIQMDKSVPETLAALVAYKREHHPHATIIAAGGINRKNVIQYAQTGVEAIVTSSLYQAGMADLTSSWKSL